MKYEIETGGDMYFFNSMELVAISQTIDQKVFLNETLKANALFRNETVRL